MLYPLLKAAAVAGLFCATTPAVAQQNAGSYLAARQAASSFDFEQAAIYYTRALVHDAQNPQLLEGALLSYVALGQIDRAAPIANGMREIGIESQLANLVLGAVAAKEGNWAEIYAALEADHSVSPLVDGLAQAWAAVGQGKMTSAIGSFDEVIEADGMRTYGLYHKALALALVGDFEGADTIFADEIGTPFTARAAIAHLQILSQLGRNDDALTKLQQVFGDTRDPRILKLRDALEADETLAFDTVTTPAEGMGEISDMIAGLLQGETRDDLTLQYARIAGYLHPNNADALMRCAALLQDLGRHALANRTFARVDPADPAFPAAEVGRIAALRALEQPDAAIEVAQNLARAHPELPIVYAKLGDALRSQSQFDAAFDAYTNALALYPDTDPNRWMVLYTRAITAHAQDNWPTAEADFRAALELKPDQPQVLNYLGYSLVERGEKLDEALEMIETAVAAQPDNGAIVDSLGWVLYRLGRVEEAVVHMERAAALEAVDPVINDHLGDVYWSVGRKVEAMFQWNRALSFDPDVELAQQIRAKLDGGLEAVAIPEEAEEIDVAHDDG